MKRLPCLLLSLALVFAVIGNAAGETILLKWGETYTLEEGKVLTFKHCAHDMDLSNPYEWLEILATIQGEVILFTARPEHIMPTFMLGGNSQVSSSGVPASSMVIAGPATISPRISAGTASNVRYFQLIATVEDLVPNGSGNLSTTIPLAAVVIPSDAVGPVEILLESSEDMVNWNSALPGFYGASTTARFFRVRAEQNP